MILFLPSTKHFIYVFKFLSHILPLPLCHKTQLSDNIIYFFNAFLLEYAFLLEWTINVDSLL